MPDKSYFKTNEEYRKWYRDYRKKNREKFRTYNREYNKRWRKINSYHNEKKWKDEHPLEVMASRILREAVRKKFIKQEPCAICKNTSHVVGHHIDYEKPLEVLWLCPKHHWAIHNLKVGSGKPNLPKITKGQINV